MRSEFGKGSEPPHLPFSPMFSHTAFPPELWGIIISHLDPFDILRLSQTSRGFHELCGQKDVWIEAVRSVCATFNLVKPAQNLQHLELGHLQRIALSPYLFDNLVESKGCSQYDKNRPVLVPKSKSTLGGESNARLHGMKLLRGGRYLLTWEGGEIHLLKIWDLGPPGKHLATQPAVIGCLRVPSSEFDPEMWALDQDGDCVRLAMIRYEPSRARLYQVHFSVEGDSSFELLGDIGVPWPITEVAFHGTCVLFSQIEEAAEIQEWFTVWDYQSHAHTSWVVSRSSEDEFLPRIIRTLFQGDFVVHFDEKGLRAFRIPRLSTPSQDDPPLKDIPAISRDSEEVRAASCQLRQARWVPYPEPLNGFDSPHFGYRILLPHKWDRTAGVPLTFSLHRHARLSRSITIDLEAPENEPGDEVVAHRYQLNLSQGSDGANLNPHLTSLGKYTLNTPSTLYRSFNDTHLEGFDPHRARFTFTEINLQDSQRTTLMISICSLGGLDSREPNASLRLTAAVRIGLASNRFGVCMASGRLVYIGVVQNPTISDEDEEGGLRSECVVCDFLWDE